MAKKRVKSNKFNIIESPKTGGWNVGQKKPFSGKADGKRVRQVAGKPDGNRMGDKERFERRKSAHLSNSLLGYERGA